MTVVRAVSNYLDPLIAPDGSPLVNTPVVFQLVDTAKRQPAALFDAVDGSYVAGFSVSSTTDGSAYLTTNLWPNDRGEFPTCYKVSLPGTVFKPFYIRVTEGEGTLSLLGARTNVEEITPQEQSLFTALLASITAALGSATSVATTTANGLMTYLDKIKLDAISGSNTGDETGATIRTKLGVTTLSGSNTGDQDLSGLVTKAGSLTQITTRNHSDLSGVGTSTHAQIDTALTRLADTSGTNTGDETGATIRTKLGVTTLSGDNTGDETGATIRTKLGVTTLSGSNTGDQDLSGYALSSALASYAPLASPTLTGTPSAPTAAADTTTTQLATTAFVLGQAATATPIATAIGGTGVTGSSKRYATADHAHPKGDASTLNGFGSTQSGAASSCVVTDASGHIALGAAASAWSTAYRVIEFGGGNALFSTTAGLGGFYTAFNGYYDGTNWRYKNTGILLHTTQNTSGFSWYSAASGTAGAAASIAQTMNLDASGNLWIAGSTATKASGTTWANPSDRRLKDGIINYVRGLNELNQLTVREWVYNGKGGTLAGVRGVGVIADEAETVLPEVVSTYVAKLDAEDAAPSTIKKVESSDIFWLMLKSIQELSAKVTDLEARLNG